MATDVAPIRLEERFDEARVAAYLRERLAGLIGDSAISFAQFPGGRANPTYLVGAGDLELVLRRPRWGRWPPAATTCPASTRCSPYFTASTPRLLAPSSSAPTRR